MTNIVIPSSGDVDGLRSRVILRASDPQKLTFVRNTDARTALARGLKEYLEQLEMNWLHGRLLKWKKFEQVWADPSVPASYPAGALIAEGAATYDDSTFTPKLIKIDDGTDRCIREVCELVQQFSLVIWTTDPIQRMGFVAMLEDALDPAEFMTGVRLELPYYFGVRATYMKTNLLYDDSMDDSQRRWRRAIIMITGNIPQIVPVGNIATIRLRLQTEVE